MKPVYKIFLKDPVCQTQDEKQAINDIGKIINSRLSEPNDLATDDRELIVTVFFNRTNIPDDFKMLDSGLYIKENTKLKSLGWIALYSTIKAGLSKVNLPENIKKVVVVLSLDVVSEDDIFAINKDKDESAAIYVAVEPNFTLDDVVMNDSEKQALLRALTIITERDLIFNKWRFKEIDHCTKSVLCFHGAAGTGKTMCAHAVAHYLGKKILIGSYSQIQSKFVGEGEKNLVAYFKAAEEQDAVLFIDEADTFLSKRLPSSNENSKHYNSMSNELYTLIENFNGCIVFASNHIKDFDPAVISRIIEPIEFKMPEKKTRIQIIKKLLPPGVPLKLNDEDYDVLSDISEGFSGRDIRKAMLLFVADAAYNHSVVAKENPDDINLTITEVVTAFKSVKKAKEDLDKGVTGFSITNRIAEENKKRTRLLQIAALALWSDGKINTYEKMLFEELSNQLGVNININDRTALPSLEQICNTILSKSDKVQMLDIACRMIAIDKSFNVQEKNYIEQLATLIGYNASNFISIEEYIEKLIKNNILWNEIVDNIKDSEYSIIKSLKKEYSEASAWNRLGIAYFNGGSIMNNKMVKNLERSKFCFEKAISLGYEIKKQYSDYFSFDK